MALRPGRKRHTRRTSPTRERWAPVHGDLVVAQDGSVGRVADVLRTERGVPRALVVAAGRVLRRYPVVSCDLITGIDGAEGVIRVRGPRRVIRSLPETLPLVF